MFISNDEIDLFINTFDKNKDGRITYFELVNELI